MLTLRTTTTQLIGCRQSAWCSTPAACIQNCAQRCVVAIATGIFPHMGPREVAYHLEYKSVRGRHCFSSHHRVQLAEKLEAISNLQSWDIQSTGEYIGRQMKFGLHCTPKRGECYHGPDKKPYIQLYNKPYNKPYIQWYTIVWKLIMAPAVTLRLHANCRCSR